MLVKGKNYCTEITLRDLQTQKGHAVGVIKITIKPDGFKKPESVRTKLKSELTFKTAEKIFGNDIKQILSNFDSPYIHKVNFESAFFHPHYTSLIIIYQSTAPTLFYFLTDLLINYPPIFTEEIPNTIFAQLVLNLLMVCLYLKQTYLIPQMKTHSLEST